jgi:homoserine O-acetyltransferase/O-succinyltransferase
VDHLLLVLGTSMGGMHTWVWGERYPDFADALVPLASAPSQIAGRNRMIRKMIIDDIRTDPEWAGGDYARQPRGLRAALQLLYVMTSSPLQQQKAAPTRDQADRWITDFLDQHERTMDANDMLYAFEASRDYDPSPALGRITAPLLAVNSADDQVNPPELGLMEALIARVPHGRYVLIPTSDRTRGHGTHTAAAVWKPWVAPFIAEAERRAGVAAPSAAAR